ncbi:carbon monoxide dehydrogenase subunit G [Roseibium sp. RKSG952]|uniref:SRPBCC family protein n=1 Tax=Roseibium sp. RKSG952 TaxID=2529384 RepID=UPI0012BB5819|nr:carbon monoxide dehydrogenase subunit G [Roseibium sp. RKSG952]MTI00069.1 carbon monoxide dehydrogenase [Roseibium sp. RKSG952]
MDMNGEYRIPAPREDVWAALNDPEILKQCIPGCDSLEMSSPTEMAAAVTSKIGPVKAKFKGSVTLENINPPESYTIVGEGKGGVAGFAKGSADVHLAEDGAETILTYTAKAQVGGKLAQLGSRLIDSTARKMADDFFSKFTELVGGGAAPEEAEAAADMDSGVVEEAKTISIEHAAEEAMHSVSEAEHVVEEKLQDVEEKLEVAAAKGRFGGPMVWGLIALVIVIIILAITG